MPFTNAEKVTMRHYTGRPTLGLFNDVRFESALTRVEDDADAVTFVRGILTRLASVETQIASMDAIVLASRGGSGAQLREGREELIRVQGRREVTRLAVALGGVDVLTDVFSAGSMGCDPGMG